ncbi:hypothetical protein Hypma_008132 [Hypsizygus marmoreus]|uniref:Uncharacterized protein n=1 Tax=Hypsizygus marmoreus TaxID=39966 RepID=A0A369JXY0_HYPMA|nr:hypothetical protein Hypma_008132 [Hypsizygus marmoreus]
MLRGKPPSSPFSMLEKRGNESGITRTLVRATRVTQSSSSSSSSSSTTQRWLLLQPPKLIRSFSVHDDNAYPTATTTTLLPWNRDCRTAPASPSSSDATPTSQWTAPPFPRAPLALPPCPPCYVAPTGRHIRHVTDQAAARRLPARTTNMHGPRRRACDPRLQYAAPAPANRYPVPGPNSHPAPRTYSPAYCLLRAPTFRPWKPGGRERIAGSCSGPAAYGGAARFPLPPRRYYPL